MRPLGKAMRYSCNDCEFKAVIRDGIRAHRREAHPRKRPCKNNNNNNKNKSKSKNNSKNKYNSRALLQVKRKSGRTRKTNVGALER
jgi:hypothetical protein